VAPTDTPIPERFAVDIPDIFVPRWPVGFDAWEGFATLVIIGLFKVDRGLMMMRRARVIDRLGWSIIIFDLTMGGLFLISMFWSLYPVPHSALGSRA
jgi:hypothetical protein